MSEKLLFLHNDDKIKKTKKKSLLEKLSLLENLLIKYKHFSPVLENPYSGALNSLKEFNCERFYADFNFIKFGLVIVSKLLNNHNHFFIKCSGLNDPDLKVILTEYVRQKNFEDVPVKFLYFEAHLSLYFSNTDNFSEGSINDANLSPALYIIYIPKPVIKNKEFYSTLTVLLRSRQIYNLPTVVIFDEDMPSEYYKDEILYVNIEDFEENGYTDLSPLLTLLRESEEKFSIEEIADLMSIKIMAENGLMQDERTE